MDEDALAHIVDDLAIRRVFAEYCHLCDDRGFDAVAECFTEDGVLVWVEDRPTGRAATAAWLADRQPPHERGEHLDLNIVIDGDGDVAQVVPDFVMVRAGVGGDHADAGRPLLRRVPAIGGAWQIHERVTKVMRSAPPPP